MSCTHPDTLQLRGDILEVDATATVSALSALEAHYDTNRCAEFAASVFVDLQAAPSPHDAAASPFPAQFLDASSVAPLFALSCQ